MVHKRKRIWAYLDGKKLVDDMKRLLIAENPGHEVTFKVV